jgi:phospholipid transport system substrate-binding protein
VIPENQHLVLVGMMGAGKTTVGRILGERLGRRVVDSDQVIESRTGRTVREIFATDGEAAFRALETEALIEALTEQEPLVIAAAGGVVLSEQNRAALRDFVASEFNNMFDRDYSARLVLGVHGRGASDADVKVFADALADSLMQRYGSSLLDLNSKLKVRVKSETPLRGGAIVKVSSEYLRQGNEPVPVDYLMRKVGTQWKVFDVMVEGVSFVQTFRNQFDTPLKQKSIPQVAADIKAGTLQAQAAAN